MSDPDDGPLQFDIPDHVIGYERTLLQIFNLWINPEVDRRVKAGKLTLPVNLVSAQVLFRSDKPPEVRLNGEVPGALEVRTSKPLVAGARVYLSEIAEFSRFELDEADADAGHFTLFAKNGEWTFVFDFQRNKRTAAALVASAEQFAATAELALSHGYQAPFVDNLFNASELLARARLITAAAEDEVKTHRTVGARINQWARLGNVDRRFIELFN